MIESSTSEPAKIYDVAQLALSFQEVAIDVVRGETTEFLSRWYRASRGEADLTIWWDGDKRVVKQQLCVYGQVIEWSPIHGTRTGLVIEHEASGESDGETASEIVRYDAKISDASVSQAVELLQAIEAIGVSDRALLVYNFRVSPRLHKNARERALRAWAPLAEGEIFSPVRPNLWKNLGRWLFGK